jgi:hypothetical protein
MIKTAGNTSISTAEIWLAAAVISAAEPPGNLPRSPVGIRPIALGGIA